MAEEGLSPGAAWPRGIALAGAVLLAVFAAWSLDIFRRAELALVDLRFALRGPLPPDPRITLVGLDEESAARYGRRTGAWTRAEYAAAVRHLTEAGAQMIVFDLIFSRSDPDPAQDEVLARALMESGRVVLATDVSERNTAYPIAKLREQEAGEGFVNLIRDPGGVVRRIPPPRVVLDEVPADSEPPAASLVLPLAVEAAVLRAHPGAAPEAEIGDERFRIGDVSVPAAAGGMLINFAGGAGTFPAIPFWRALEGAIPEGAVDGKIVLVGSTHPLQHDHFPVPFRASHLSRSGFRERRTVELGDMYGVEIQAHALDTLISGRPLVEAGRGVQYGAWGIAGSLSALLLVILRTNPWVSSALLAGGIAAHGGVAQWLFVSRGVVVDVVPGGLVLIGHFVTGILLHRALELRRRREMQRLFGRYVSPRVAEALLENPELVRLGGRKAVLTVFFSDIRGFTRMSESLPPEEVAALLQEYFTEMTEVVFEHGGTLDKFMGDAIMVFFGDPVPQPDHAERAVRMALEMKARMERLKARWLSEGRRTFDPGIGINTGEVVVGNTGSADRFSYTVLGDNVNLAQRLEASAGPGQILLSAATYAAVADAEEKFAFSRLPPLKVKGKERPVTVYEVLYARDASSR